MCYVQQCVRARACACVCLRDLRGEGGRKLAEAPEPEALAAPGCVSGPAGAASLSRRGMVAYGMAGCGGIQRRFHPRLRPRCLQGRVTAVCRAGLVVKPAEPFPEGFGVCFVEGTRTGTRVPPSPCPCRQPFVSWKGLGGTRKGCPQGPRRARKGCRADRPLILVFISRAVLETPSDQGSSLSLCAPRLRISLPDGPP